MPAIVAVNGCSGRLGPLAGRNFRRFYVGYATSMLGTSMSAVAIAFAVLASGGTATSLGVVFAANIVPMVAFMLGGGVLADRLGRRPVMLTADVARCAAQGALAVTLFLGHPRIWLFVVAAFVVGTGNAFFQPALSGLPVQLAPRDQLGNANALFGMVQPAAQVAGPALAGIVIAAGSPAAAIAVDAGSYAVSALALAFLSFPAHGTRPGPVAAARPGRWLGGVLRARLALAADRPVHPVQPADLGPVPGAWPGAGPRLPRRRPRLGCDPGQLRRAARSSAACSRSAAAPAARCWPAR